MKSFTVNYRIVVIICYMAVLSGCVNGSATIRYEQLGACNGYKDEYGVHTAGAGFVYEIFKVRDINNLDGKIDFNYDPALLFVEPNLHASANLQLIHKIGVLASAPAVVPAGKLLGHNGFVVVVVPAPDKNSIDPQREANKKEFLLSYENNVKGFTVVMDKINIGQTQYSGASNCLEKRW